MLQLNVINQEKTKNLKIKIKPEIKKNTKIHPKLNRIVIFA